MSLCPHHVRLALEDSRFAVRPEGAPVPEHLLGTSLEPIFSALVRMNDGPPHLALKSAMSAALAHFDAVEIQRISREVSHQLVSGFSPPLTGEDVTYFCYGLPVCVIGNMLGFSPTSWRTLTADVLDFVRCIAPGTTAQQLQKGEAATDRLLNAIPAKSPLKSALGTEFTAHDIDHNRLNANILGLLFQSCEGTAGLLGQSLMMARAGAEKRQSLIDKVLHISPPIKNTRRFALAPITLAGITLNKGEMLVLPLAEGHAFGHGAHACPGESWAKIIADSGLSMLLALAELPSATEHFRWRESQNARVPEFYTATSGECP